MDSLKKALGLLVTAIIFVIIEMLVVYAGYNSVAFMFNRMDDHVEYSFWQFISGAIAVFLSALTLLAVVYIADFFYGDGHSAYTDSNGGAY